MYQRRATSLSDFAAGIFRPGIQPEIMSMFFVVVVGVIATCLFLIISDPGNIHYFMMFMLSLGLMFSLMFFVVESKRGIQQKPSPSANSSKDKSSSNANKKAEAPAGASSTPTKKNNAVSASAKPKAKKVD